MPHKSPCTDWVADEWDEIVLKKGDMLTHEQRMSRWLSLYARVYVNGQWVVHSDDAGLVASTGAYLYREAEDFESARDICRQFLDHPDIDSQNFSDDFAHFLAFEAVMTMYCGREHEGATSLLDRLLASQRPSFLRTYSISRIGAYLHDDPRPKGHPTEALKVLVAHLLEKKRAPKKVIAIAREAMTYEELSLTLGWISEQYQRHFERRQKTANRNPWQPG